MGEVHQAQEVADRDVQLNFEGLVIHCGHAQIRDGLLTGNDLCGVDHLADVRQHIGILGSIGGVNSTLPAEHEVGCGDGVTVGPLCIAQVEGISLTVLADVVGLGEGRDSCAVGVHLHQTVGVVGDDLEGGAVGGDLRVQRLDFSLQHDVQGAACGSASCAGSTGGGSGRRCRGAGASAGRQGQSCCGYACCCQKAAARNTTIESHNIFSPL